MSDDAATPGRLCREYVLSPITALAFLTLGEKQYLLAAEDTDIKIYDVAASRLCGALPVFHAQPIHGISVPPAAEEDRGSSGAPKSPSQILVWGGHAVKVLPTRVVEELVYASTTESDGSAFERSGLIATALAAPEAIAPDWIFDGRISPFDDTHIVLLTAHNEVVQGHVSADRKTLLLDRVRSPSRPILYSGNFFWVNQDCVLVAAGTVFGEIVVWKCHLNSDDYGRGTREDETQEKGETAGCEVLFVFSGHEGSIFGVHISPEIVMSSGETVRLLASCSDDRTIRIWDITERSDEPTNDRNEYGTQISDARETGFGDSIIGSIGLVSSHSRCIAIAMGHVSRIWQVEINSPGLLASGDIVEVYSFGEDATMQKWHLDLNKGLEAISGTPKTQASNSPGEPPSKLTHHETFSNHRGKQIWSHAMVTDKNGLLIATGGGDGKIALMENNSSHVLRTLDDDASHYLHSIQELDISPMSLIEQCQQQNLGTTSSLSSFKHGNGKEVFQSFAFISDNKLLLTTRSGRLFLGRFDSKTEWKELTIPDNIRKTIQSYTILRSPRKASTAFIGAPNGELFYYHEASRDSLQSIYKAERKIIDIFCLSDNIALPPHTDYGAAGEPDGYIELLVTVFGSTKAELLRFDQNRILIQKTEVKIPDRFIVTSASWCHNYLILGSRNGSLSVFDMTTDEDYSPLLTIQVKIGDKITSILPLPRQSENSPLYLLTTARDGKYRIYEILGTTSTLQLRLLHETKPPFGPLIEGSWLFDKANGKRDLMLCGFRGKYFVLWNETKQTEVATIDCGGGHRIFDQVQVAGNPEGLRFACTKASQMRIFSQTCAPHLPLKTGGHGREIKSASASGKYVATGAEDTMIRIWELHETDRGEQRLRCVLALEKHNTGIQKLKWFKDQYLFSSGGNEEFFVWRITALESDICPLGVVCEAVFPDRSEVGDLRITDFDVQCLNEDARAEDEADGSDVQSGGLQTGPKFCISMTLSNSSVQSYLYSARQGFQLLGRQTYTGACLTQLRHLDFTDGCYPRILTAATDGHLAVFTDIRCRPPEDETEEPTEMLVTKLHQSTIKSLDIRSIITATGTSYLVVTGGDDDAIGVMHLHRHPSGQTYEIRNKSIVRSAHAAAVTGLGIARLESGGRDAVVVTASNDQRVKTWRLVDWCSASLRVHLLDDRYSGVADAGDLEVVGESCGDGDEGRLDGNGRGRVLVAGVGIEAWDVS
ncbi:WD40-repeat-containing domain protein [Xylaria cf. heliscus]|nr:WD40-repeat-containing domain protein [Xylaria cf. heliscus]